MFVHPLSACVLCVAGCNDVVLAVSVALCQLPYLLCGSSCVFFCLGLNINIRYIYIIVAKRYVIAVVPPVLLLLHNMRPKSNKISVTCMAILQCWQCNYCELYSPLLTDYEIITASFH